MSRAYFAIEGRRHFRPRLDRLEMLRDIGLTIDKGDCVPIIGHAGSPCASSVCAIAWRSPKNPAYVRARAGVIGFLFARHAAVREAA